MNKSSNAQNSRLVLPQWLMWNAGKTTVGETFGREYVSVMHAGPEFGPNKLCANLGGATCRMMTDYFALIWKSTD